MMRYVIHSHIMTASKLSTRYYCVHPENGCEGIRNLTLDSSHCEFDIARGTHAGRKSFLDVAKNVNNHSRLNPVGSVESVLASNQSWVDCPKIPTDKTHLDATVVSGWRNNRSQLTIRSRPNTLSSLVQERET